jgi:hypothetical protein
MRRLFLTHTYRRCAETPNGREISSHTACVLPNFMPFAQDLLYPHGEFRRLTSREVSLASPYSTFSHTSTLPSALVDVHLFPSKTYDR